MRLLGQFETSLFTKRFHKKNKKDETLQANKNKKFTYSLICVFVLLPGRLCTFCGCIFMLVRGKSFYLVKKIKRHINCPNDLIYITTDDLVDFLELSIFINACLP